ncbi:MAG: hypothetical protein AAF135_12015, partial [Bacteroidota bacterium]
MDCSTKPPPFRALEITDVLLSSSLLLYITCQSLSFFFLYAWISCYGSIKICFFLYISRLITYNCFTDRQSYVIVSFSQSSPASAFRSA